MKRLPVLLRDKSGVSLVEYGLIAALILLVLIVGFTSLGSSLSSSFNKVIAHIPGR